MFDKPRAQSHVAVIVGISGAERYLGRDRREVPEKKEAKRFRSPDAAERAAKAHIEAFPPVITRSMKYRVIPADGAAS